MFVLQLVFRIFMSIFLKYKINRPTQAVCSNTPTAVLSLNYLTMFGNLLQQKN